MVKLGEALRAAGWEVHFLSPASNEEARKNEISERGDATFHEFNYSAPNSPFIKILNSVRGVQTYRSLVQQIDFDIVLDDVSHIPFYPAHFLAPDRTANALFIHTLYLDSASRYLGVPKGQIIHMIEKTLPHLNSPIIVCAGPSTESRVQSGLNHNQTAILNPCIELDEFEFSPSPESGTVLYLGRLTRRKNVSTLLDAWKSVESESDEFELVVAGTGYKETELQNQAAQLGLTNVDFRGYVSEDEKHELLSNASLFVIPSLMEGYVTTGIEALASGTPVIGADTYGINDYIRDGENGRLVPPEDPKKLGSVLVETLRSPNSIQHMAESGRVTAEDHSFTKFTEQADALFTSMSQREDQ
jgi:glycosyltransferase involved in cell wall biosynthesis